MCVVQGVTMCVAISSLIVVVIVMPKEMVYYCAAAKRTVSLCIHHTVPIHTRLYTIVVENKCVIMYTFLMAITPLH